MVLTSVKLKNFRVHHSTELNFSNRLNFLVGGNGQGKTSILESIYYLCTTKSFDAKSDSEVVAFGENGFEIFGEIEDLTKDEVMVVYSAEEAKKRYYLNGKLLNRSSEIIGRFPIVLLTPADHAITQGTPGERRKFVDSVLSQASKTYLKNLLDYGKILRQRSSLLNQMRESYNSRTKDELDVWTERLIASGSEIIKQRLRFINEFNPFVTESYSKVMNENEIPGIKYYHLNGYNGENIIEKFKSLLDEKQKDEFRRAANLVGPHRDDFVFTINDINLKTYGSQGQHKTFQAVLRFAEFFYLKSITGKKPVFLLDDVFGELDTNRADKISRYLREVGQAFVTLTDFSNLKFLTKNENDKIITISGSVTANA